MIDRDQALPNPFAELPAPAPEPDLADIVAAIEAELRAWLDPPPLFLTDEFAERIRE